MLHIRPRISSQRRRKNFPVPDHPTRPDAVEIVWHNAWLVYSKNGQKIETLNKAKPRVDRAELDWLVSRTSNWC